MSRSEKSGLFHFAQAFSARALPLSVRPVSALSGRQNRLSRRVCIGTTVCTSRQPERATGPILTASDGAGRSKTGWSVLNAGQGIEHGSLSACCFPSVQRTQIVPCWRMRANRNEAPGEGPLFCVISRSGALCSMMGNPSSNGPEAVRRARRRSGGKIRRHR